MTDPDMFTFLFNYHWDTNRRLLEHASQLEPQDYFEDRGYGQGSIHGLFFHLLRTDRDWRIAMETGRRPEPLAFESYPGIEALRGAFEAEEAAWRDYLAALSTEQVQREVAMQGRGGKSLTFPRWRILEHLVLHGMQHHAELAHWLTEAGHSPGNLDLVFYAPRQP